MGRQTLVRKGDSNDGICWRSSSDSSRRERYQALTGLSCRAVAAVRTGAARVRARGTGPVVDERQEACWQGLAAPGKSDDARGQRTQCSHVYGDRVREVAHISSAALRMLEADSETTIMVFYPQKALSNDQLISWRARRILLNSPTTPLRRWTGTCCGRPESSYCKTRGSRC